MGMASDPERRRGRPLLRLGPKKDGPTDRAETMEGGGDTDEEEAASLLARLLATAVSRA